ncbi:ciliogenesis and planar polarity effector 2 isoform X2 [Brachyhypopomus gauderio]|uniref:ciliogenesis and planar polarity effector 2 isoform X2 n=1 Tax=Brachyhypopomus gauderio TaxID=698409 RepID=UPI00404213B8
MNYGLFPFFHFAFLYGLLEAPVMPPNLKVDTVRYKVFISGKSGVGKSALAARLTGLEIPNLHYETTGMETSVVFWPVKLRETGRVLFFHFQLWDCGENVMRRFDHMLPSCKEHVDAILFLFSFTDHGSFEDISNQMSRLTDPSDRVVRLVVGTKFDLFMHTDVTESEIAVFQEVLGAPVFRVGGDVSNGLGEIAPLLNALAENLWHQDCANASYNSPLPSTYPEDTGPEVIV